MKIIEIQFVYESPLKITFRWIKIRHIIKTVRMSSLGKGDDF